MRTRLMIPLVLAATTALAGCNSNPTKQDVGTVSGAVVGGIVGASLTGTTTGAVAGAAAGGLVGNRIAKELEHK